MPSQYHWCPMEQDSNSMNIDQTQPHFAVCTQTGKHKCQDTICTSTQLVGIIGPSPWSYASRLRSRSLRQFKSIDCLGICFIPIR